jgi:hypothetical protein
MSNEEAAVPITVRGIDSVCVKHKSYTMPVFKISLDYLSEPFQILFSNPHLRLISNANWSIVLYTSKDA